MLTSRWANTKDNFFGSSYALVTMFLLLIFFICSNFQLDIMLLRTCEDCLDKGGVLGSNVDLMVSSVLHLQFTKRIGLVLVRIFYVALFYPHICLGNWISVMFFFWCVFPIVIYSFFSNKDSELSYVEVLHNLFVTQIE